MTKHSFFKKNRIVIVSMIMIFVWGLITSVLVPTWQVPDEHSHLTMIGQNTGDETMSDEISADIPFSEGKIIGNSEMKINVEEWENAWDKPYIEGLDDSFTSLKIAAIKHLPAVIGLFIGKVLHLSSMRVMFLGELFSLIIAVLLMGLALYIMPVKKEILLMIMAFPMTIQQISSISYDAFLLPLSFLLISFSMYLRYGAEKIKQKHILIFVILFALVSYIKMPCLLMGFLILLIPNEKVDLNIGKFHIDGEKAKKFRIPFIIVLIVLIIGGMFVLRNNYWIRIVIGMLQEPKRSLYLFKSTYDTFRDHLLISSVGMFGWLDSQVPMGFVYLTYLILLVLGIFGRDDNLGERKKSSVIASAFVIVLFIALTAFTCMSMVNHTVSITLLGEETIFEYNPREALYQIPFIGGLQGRYFLPFMALPFIALPMVGKPLIVTKREINIKYLIVYGYIVFAAYTTIKILLNRYWI